MGVQCSIEVRLTGDNEVEGAVSTEEDRLGESRKRFGTGSQYLWSFSFSFCTWLAGGTTELDMQWSGKVGRTSGIRSNYSFKGSCRRVPKEWRAAAIRSRPESRMSTADPFLLSVVLWGCDLSMWVDEHKWNSGNAPSLTMSCVIVVAIVMSNNKIGSGSFVRPLLLLYPMLRSGSK